VSSKGPETPIQLKITLPPRLILIALIIWAVFVAAYICLSAYRGIIVFGASSLGALSALIGAIYLARGLILAVQQQEDLMHQKKTENAWRYIERWNNPQYHYVKMAGVKVLKMNETEKAEIVTVKINEDEAFRSNVTDLLNFFEEMAIAIDMGVADENTLKRAFRGLLHLYCMALQDFVKQRRTKFNNPRILLEIENLYTRWSSDSN
jgi:transcriptional accessory protein Tex/SPT6